MNNYKEIKPKLFTEDGVNLFIGIRDGTKSLLSKSGAVTMGQAMSSGKGGGDSWMMMACVDRMVELGEIREINQGRDVAGQNRVFVSA